eukprot:scaffold14233_cov21-Tisochrysis_lutea.AAC.3
MNTAAPATDGSGCGCDARRRRSSASLEDTAKVEVLVVEALEAHIGNLRRQRAELRERIGEFGERRVRLPPWPARIRA